MNPAPSTFSPISTSPTPQNIVAVFPGQGSQQVGMGKDFFENFSVARQAFEEASDAIHIDLKKICFEGPDSELLLTENTQPALLTTSVAAFRVVEQELGWIPHAAAGHSLGEYSALVALGSLELGVAARWVRERGKAMQKAVPAGEGSMAAILGLDDLQVENLCHQATQVAALNRQQGANSQLTVLPIVEPANWNAGGQVVIAGSTDALQEAFHLLKSEPAWAGGKAIPLTVSAPFHCQLMGPARDAMANLFSKITPQEKPKMPRVPYVPNRTARLLQEPTLILDLLIEQIDHPVLWKQSVLALLEFRTRFESTQALSSQQLAPPQQTPSVGIEFGPGKVLSGLMKRISQQASQPCTLISIQESASLKNLESVLKKIR